jgi:hypothetical protein
VCYNTLKGADIKMSITNEVLNEIAWIVSYCKKTTPTSEQEFELRKAEIINSIFPRLESLDPDFDWIEPEYSSTSGYVLAFYSALYKYFEAIRPLTMENSRSLYRDYYPNFSDSLYRNTSLHNLPEDGPSQYYIQNFYNSTSTTPLTAEEERYLQELNQSVNGSNLE